MADNTQFEVRGQSYSRIILPLARQERSMLYSHVYIKTDVEGKSFYQDQIGSWEMKPKTSVNSETPQNDPNLVRTRIDIQTYHDSRMFDRSLKLQELSDPISVSSLCIQSAVGVQLDKVIYDALGGIAYRGENGGTAVAFPSAKTIPVDMEDSGTNTGLTINKIRRAAKMLDAKGVYHYDRCFVASATAKEQLLGTTPVTDANYNTIRALVQGDIDTFVGFKFVFLPDGIINVENNIADYFAFQKTGVGFGMLEELFLRVEDRPDKSYSKQIYYEISCGAGRLEEDKVIKVKGDESVVVINKE